MRDYMSYKIHNASPLIEELGRQEQIVRDARGPEGRARRDEAERRAKIIREKLLPELPPAASYEYLDATGKGNAVNFRSAWQEKNYGVDCLESLARGWKEGKKYYQDNFAVPRIELGLFPGFSFVIQFSFTLAQPYISRDEQNFYVIDNPVRKDKIFGLPYVAPASWKGSLRAALWQLDKKADNENICHLFGNVKEIEDENEKEIEESEKEIEGEEASHASHAGRLHFFPTFFTRKGLEVINPQDRKTRAGSNPIPFESVPRDSQGHFTLLYVPFDLIGGDDKETREQVSEELKLVAKGLQAMFRVYGFGAKTSSGFGLAQEKNEGTLNMTGGYQEEKFTNFTGMVENVEKFATQLIAK